MRTLEEEVECRRLEAEFEAMCLRVHAQVEARAGVGDHNVLLRIADVRQLLHVLSARPPVPYKAVAKPKPPRLATPRILLSETQTDMLLICAGRGTSFLRNRCERGIVAPYQREMRTVKALKKMGLIKWVWAGNATRSGITLTQAGADILSPPAKVTYP